MATVVSVAMFLGVHWVFRGNISQACSPPIWEEKNATSVLPLVTIWKVLDINMSVFLLGSLGEPPLCCHLSWSGTQTSYLFLSMAPVITSKSLSQMLEGSIPLSLGTSITTSQVS